MNSRTEVLLRDAASLAIGLMLAGGAIALFNITGSIVLRLVIAGGFLLVYVVILAIIWDMIDLDD